MIHVDMQPEPDDFEEVVRTPGMAFLATCPNPTRDEWASHSYWRHILKELRRRYGCICAYSCHWVAPDTGGRTVEHFIPKHEEPERAYDWDNYRFVCQLLNARKRTRTDTLDPFEVEDGWFIIDFPSLLVKAAPNLPDDLAGSVRRTILRLGLNDEDSCLENRANYVKGYCVGGMPFSYIEKEAPFLAKEIRRQKLVYKIKKIMIYND